MAATARFAVALLVAFACAPARAQSPSCFPTAADQDALVQCAKSELVPLESKVAAAYARLQGKYRDAPAMLEGLDKARRQWDAYRDAQCSVEGKAHAADGAMELQRALLGCIRREFEQRLRELEAL